MLNAEWVLYDFLNEFYAKIQLIHHSSLIIHHYFNTQVSLLPPPCDELTTNEPFFKATLVNPPGVT